MSNTDTSTTNTSNGGILPTKNRPLTVAEQNLVAIDKPPLYKFVFTGGPCGGKTTGLARVFSFLRERNFEVINCPESYTILNSNGMSSDYFTTEGMSKIIQSTVMSCQLTFENTVARVLTARGKPGIMLIDRGLMDGSIFVSKEEFNEVLEEHNLDIVQARDNRYDAIFHLVTAADGAEAFYTLENNTVRWESKEQARINDKLIQKAWVGHPHLYVIDNSTDFEGKMNRLVDIICNIVGLPSDLRRRSVRFLLKEPPNLQEFSKADINYQVFDVEKVYLQKSTNSSTVDKDTYSFIRRRTSIDPITETKLGSVYQITNVRHGTRGIASSPSYINLTNAVEIDQEDTTETGQSDYDLIEQKRIITRREYDTAYSNSRDLTRHIVLQRRVSFLYAKQSFTIHTYKHPVPGLSILHAQVEAKKGHEQLIGKHNDSTVPLTTSESSLKRSTSSIPTDDIILPPFLSYDRRLSSHSKEDDELYGAYSLSMKR
jgi:AAA domain